MKRNTGKPTPIGQHQGRAQRRAGQVRRRRGGQEALMDSQEVLVLEAQLAPDLGVVVGLEAGAEALAQLQVITRVAIVYNSRSIRVQLAFTEVADAAQQGEAPRRAARLLAQQERFVAQRLEHVEGRRGLCEAAEIEHALGREHAEAAAEARHLRQGRLLPRREQGP